MDEIFRANALVVLAIAAVLAFFIGLAFGSKLPDVNKPPRLERAAEAFILALLGGFFARTFVSILLSTAEDAPLARLVIGWATTLWPGAIDTIPHFFGAELLTGRETLLWIALVVGAFTGMMDGIWRVYDWTGLGVPSFVLDKTWGLAGTTNAALLHLWNIFGKHVDEPRENAHRYSSGFHIKSGFAFTQGSVMSELTAAPGGALYDHEYTHVWQNRIFGPLFVLTYIGWMAVTFIPSLIAGVVTRGVTLGQGIERYCYFDNPWETWGYAVQKADRKAVAGGPELVWSDTAVVLWSIPYFLAAIVAIYFLLGAAW